MFSMLCLELSDGRILSRKEANSMFEVALIPIDHVELLKLTCQTHSYILMFDVIFILMCVILARIKGCVVVSNVNVEKQQHCSDEATLSH